MSHWEEELLTLLESLGVTLEAGGVLDGSALGAGDFPTDSQVREWEAMQQQEESAASDPEEDQFAMVNREMEATLREVAQLVRKGYLDPALRDDVLHVLRALTRPPQGLENDQREWQLTSAAAVLHFCRVVLRLAQALTRRD